MVLTELVVGSGVAPQKLERVEHEGGGLVRGWQAVVRPAALLAAAEEPGLAQQRQVPRNGGERQSEQFHDLAHAQLSAAAGGEDAESPTIGQSGADGEDGIGGLVLTFRHITKYMP